MSTTDAVHDVWPAHQEHVRPIVATCYLISVAVLASLLSRRWIGWNQMKRLPIAKLMVLAVLGDSLLFVFASAVLVLGVGTSFSEAACRVGIWWCIILYASSKVLIYSFLSEKLYAVYSATPTRRIPRWQSTQYKIAIAFLILWLGVAVVMIVGRIADIREHDNACVIGLKLYSTVPMLTVDAIVNIYLTAAFVLPVYRSRWHKAQTLALHSCIAAVASLITSFANILVLSIQHGHQLSWVCLGSCGLDVSINAIILYIVTSTSSSSNNTADDYTGGGGGAHNSATNNKANVSGLRSMGGGGGLSSIPNHSRFSNPFSNGSTSISKSSPGGGGIVRPATLNNLDSSETFESGYTVSKIDLEEVETGGGGIEEKVEVVLSSSEQEGGEESSRPCSPRQRQESKTRSDLAKRSESESKDRGERPCCVKGIHISEEVVRVEESSGLTEEELREEEEWFRKGRCSRVGSQCGNGNGFGSGSANASLRRE
ncbi:hypothetical protein JCM16303_001124 [Sporobolomyces ruberrimus]